MNYELIKKPCIFLSMQGFCVMNNAYYDFYIYNRNSGLNIKDDTQHEYLTY